MEFILTCLGCIVLIILMVALIMCSMYILIYCTLNFMEVMKPIIKIIKNFKDKEVVEKEKAKLHYFFNVD